jgi:hypothetical protein
MDEQTISNMRSRIIMCRRLAEAQTDPEVAATLRQMADEGEADLARITAEQENP